MKKIKLLIILTLIIAVVAVCVVTPGLAFAEELPADEPTDGAVVEELPDNVFNQIAAWFNENKATIISTATALFTAVLALLWTKIRTRVAELGGTIISSTNLSSKNVNDVVKTVNKYIDAAAELKAKVIESECDAVASKIYAKGALELMRLMLEKSNLPEATKNFATIVYTETINNVKKEIENLTAEV